MARDIDLAFTSNGYVPEGLSSTPSFFMALETLRQSDMVAFIPSRLLPAEGLFEVPVGLHDGAPVGMSQAKVDLASRLALVSGQVDWDRDSRVRHGTPAGQAEGAIQHLRTVLDEAGASLADVLQLRVYVRGELADGMAELVPVLARHFGAVRPALTGIGVASLASRDTLVEIEALARLPDRA